MKQIVVLCIFSLFAKGKIPKFFYLKCVDQAEKKNIQFLCFRSKILDHLHILKCFYAKAENLRIVKCNSRCTNIAPKPNGLEESAQQWSLGPKCLALLFAR